ncbi:caspase family protein [Kitasatospora sp. RG8]|nr:caspase family protein [Kitasatospora sp. RG8]
MAGYPKNREWDRPGLLEARDRIVRVFTGRLGYRFHDAVALNPTKDQLTDALHAFCISPERRENDQLAVYLSCHGEVLDDGGEHVLLTSDTDPADLAYTALPTAELCRAMLHGTRIRRVLLLLDACYAGHGGNQLTSAALERLGATWGRTSGAGLVILSSAQPHQQAKAGLFPQLLEAAVAGRPVAGHGPPTLPLHAVVQHINTSPDRPAHQRVGLAMVGLDGEPPSFLPNPRHDARLTEVDLALQQAAAFAEQDRLRDTEFTSRLVVRAMAYQNHQSDGEGPAWWFSGRHTALRDLATWLDGPAETDGTACRVVTAAPGSGKTAVLGLIAVLTHPDRRRTVPFHGLGLPEGLLRTTTLDVVVYAQRLSDTDVLRAVGAAARVRAETVGELLDALGRRPWPLTVLVDALDEAATPETLCTTILRPLIEHAQGRIRLLLGTRPNLLPRLGVRPEQVVNLDDDRYADPEAITAYAARTLLEASRTSPYRRHPQALQPVAEAVARAAGNSFLIARIAAGTLAAAEAVVPDPDDPAWQATLPRHAGDAMREDLQQRLGPHAQRATDLLRPLAFVHGQGLPWEDIWAPLATEISGRVHTDDDLLWLRRTAGSYVVESTENGRSAYRLYHQAMADHLRDDTADAVAVHAAYTRTLTSRVPYRADAGRDWSRAHPYALDHLADHATRAGQLDALLGDIDYLVHANPRSLTPHLHHTEDASSRLTAAVYRTSLNLHHAAAPVMRRQILALDAARAGAHDLYQCLSRGIPPGHWAPVWATGSTFSPALRDTLTDHGRSVGAVACTTLDGAPVAVAGKSDAMVRIWDLRTGHPLGRPLTGHAGYVSSVACTALDGVPVAVTGGEDGTVRIWDLRRGRPLGRPLTGHVGYVSSVACTALDGVPVAVTGGEDSVVRVWDLRTGGPLGRPLLGHTDVVRAVACTALDGVPVAVTGGEDSVVRVWDLRTGEPLGRPLLGHTDVVRAVACTTLDGAPVAVTGSNDSTVRVWDLRTGRPLGRPLTGHTGYVSSVACTSFDDNPVALTGSNDNTVRVWDLRTGEPLGRPLTGHTGAVRAVACTTLDGAPVSVTGSWDGTLRMWDLRTRRLGRPLTGHTGYVRAVACTTLDGAPGSATDSNGNTVPVAVTGSNDSTVRMWTLRTGEPLGRPLTGHTGAVRAVACTTLDGAPVAVTGSEDDTVRIWDLRTGRPLGQALTGHTGVRAVACTTLDGTPVAVTGSKDAMARIWSLRTGRRIAEPLAGHAEAVRAVACASLDGAPVAVTGSDDSTVRIWDLRAGRPLGQPLTGHTRAVSAVACAILDDVPVAVTGSDDSTVRVWDLRTGEPLGRPLTGHTGAVRAVACTTLDGTPVAVTGSRDGTARIWDLRSRTVTASLAVSSPRTAVFTPAGDLMVGFHRDIALFRRKAPFSMRDSLSRSVDSPNW